MKGIFEFEVCGKKRGFKFGTYGFSVACEKDGCSLGQLFKKIGLPYEVEIVKEDGEKEKVQKREETNLLSLLHLFYGTAVHYADHMKQPVDFSASDVSDWIDEIGLAAAQDMLVDGLETYVPKNSKSPEPAGEVTTQ